MEAAARAAVLRDARHAADASEILFELLVWEDPLTPRMRPVSQRWRAPSAATPASGG